jgi:hypothetical protein
MVLSRRVLRYLKSLSHSEEKVNRKKPKTKKEGLPQRGVAVAKVNRRKY